MDGATKKLIQRIQADPNIHMNWKLDSFRSKEEKEQARKEKEAWESVDQIRAKHQAIKYKSSSKFTQFWIDFFGKF